MTKTNPRFFGLIFCLLAMMLSGCAVMPNSGASRIQVQHAASSRSLEGVLIKQVDDTLARKLSAEKHSKAFADVFGNAKPSEYLIGPGDTIVISVWETPPSILFGGVALDSKVGTLNTSAEALPSQMVMVRVSGSPTSQVAIIGDVAKSANMPLTPKGERLLDALASVGGVTQPVTKVSVQLTRAGVSATMPLDTIVHDPRQNIPLQPGDVLTALYQPWTISVLGATGRNQEVPFEARGISLAQALARSGGLNDNRADPGGVFVFRFEDASLVEGAPAVNGKVPVVYQVNFNDPGTFFVTQNFPMQDKDVLYVANMPSAEIEKFLRMVGMVLTPTLNLGRYQLQVSQ